MNVYVIRHKPTSEFMPIRMTRTASHGWSHWEPGGTMEDPPFDSNPRLFYSLQSARNALTMWLAGAWHRDQGHGGGMEGDDYWDELVPQAPKQPRSRADMEIVTLELIGL